MPPVDPVKLRQAVLDWLRTHPVGSLSYEYESPLWKFLMEKKLGLDHPDAKPVVVVMADLVREGIVVPGVTRGNQYNAWTFPNYFVSPYGEKVLANQDFEPHDPDGYLARLRREVTDPDPVALAYLAESIEGFRSLRLLSAAVMLGGAAERAFLETVESLKAPLGGDFPKSVDRAFWISEKRDILVKTLAALDPLPGDLADRVKFALNSGAEAIRFARNDVGHPKMVSMDRDAVHGYLVVFPTAYKVFRALLTHFNAPVKPLPVTP